MKDGIARAIQPLRKAASTPAKPFPLRWQAIFNRKALDFIPWMRRRISIDAAHPLHVVNRRQLKAFEKSPFNWFVGVHGVANKSSVVRNYCKRRIQLSINRALNLQGWDQNGNVLPRQEVEREDDRQTESGLRLADVQGPLAGQAIINYETGLERMSAPEMNARGEATVALFADRAAAAKRLPPKGRGGGQGSKQRMGKAQTGAPR